MNRNLVKEYKDWHKDNKKDSYSLMLLLIVIIIGLIVVDWISSITSYESGKVIFFGTVLLAVFLGIFGGMMWFIFETLPDEVIVPLLIVSIFLATMITATLPITEQNITDWNNEIKIVSYEAVDSYIEYNISVLIVHFNATGNYNITYGSSYSQIVYTNNNTEFNNTLDIGRLSQDYRKITITNVDTGSSEYHYIQPDRSHWLGRVQ